jgi:hypothetical protein
MIPGMAMLTSAANPALRGTFMTLNSAVQSCAMGLATLVGGHIISRDAAGLVQNYGVAGLVGGGRQSANDCGGSTFATSSDCCTGPQVESPSLLHCITKTHCIRCQTGA